MNVSRRLKLKFLCLTAMLMSSGILPARARGEWVSLRWMEKPSQLRQSIPARAETTVMFTRFLSVDGKSQSEESWQFIMDNLKEGDLIAYHMDKWQARTDIFLKGHFNKVGYRLFKYGHLALVVQDPYDADTLRLFSSQAFVGPNIRETIDTLKHYSWDVYRMNRWDQIDRARLHEFIHLARDRGEKWYGYDFSGMFGLWNSNLRPNSAEEIGHDYICSTVVLAAFHYAGLQLDSERRRGILDIVTPFQIINSKGRITGVPTADDNRFDSAKEGPHTSEDERTKASEGDTAAKLPLHWGIMIDEG